ncbi:solute carrier family 2, facilitated glucose transporter member 2 [Plakobranchus ocellatus]|uniref:Solute carrier family 2, facilitated glucose transporter member 2 n=1 Tax=Plakobranchus ocellatus TaxID=259542 RepID=A0AAV3ZYF1_9GAST|nr:solute carrier family 2, facilitated glucose transporter member 2 [Plakobranchus ocellatus]
MYNYHVSITIIGNFGDKKRQLVEATVAAVTLFILGFGIGPGPIPFTVAPELFPSDVKRSALSICVGFNWLANFSVGFAFPHILAQLGYLAFSVFAVTSFLLFVFLYFLLPETRPGPLEDLSFSYPGEEFNQAARASLSIGLGSSLSDGHVSKESNVADLIKQGFSVSAAILHSEDLHNSRKYGSGKQSSRRKSANYRRIPSSESGKSARGQAVSDPGSAFTRVHREQSRTDTASPQGFAFDMGKKLKKVNLYDAKESDKGSSNSGLTSLMNTPSDDFNQSGRFKEDNYSVGHLHTLQNPHDVICYDSTDEYGRFDYDAEDAEKRRLLVKEKGRRSSHQPYVSVQERWTESCDADAEAD